MIRRFWLVIAIALLALMFVSAAGAMAQDIQEETPPPLAEPVDAAGDTSDAQATYAYTYTTVITVTSTSDPNNSDSQTCSTLTCTLRQAVIQARHLPANQKPVQIAFNIPAGDPGYDAALGIWKVQFIYISNAANAALRYLNGNIIIDGSTQPGGRASGPKIILVGPGTGQKDGIKIGETTSQNNNHIYRLGFQNFTTHLYVNSGRNTIIDNWFGLNDAGTAPYLRNGNKQDGSGSAGIAMSGGATGADSNTVRNNVFLGFDGVALAVRGRNNIIATNLVGTAADGATPGKQTDPSLICTTDDWLGGGGISVQDQTQVIENNTIAGLRQEILNSHNSPTPSAWRGRVTSCATTASASTAPALRWVCAAGASTCPTAPGPPRFSATRS